MRSDEVSGCKEVMIDMAGKRDAKKVVAAIKYLRDINEFYEFDEQERVTRVCVWRAPNGDEAASHIGSLLDLRELLLHSPSLTDAGLIHLRPLVKLRKLELRSPRITGEGLSCSEGMRQLRELIIYLEELDGCAFEHLAKPRNLIELMLKGGRFSDEDLAPMVSLVKLQTLSIDDAPGIQGTCTTHLIGLPDLRKIVINPQVTDDGLTCTARLSQLRELCLEGVFTDEGMLQLRSLRDLRDLEIHSPHVTSRGVAIVAELPELRSLCVNIPLVTDDVIPSLERCQGLENLSFRSPVLSDSGLQYIRDVMPRCEVLDLVRDHHEAASEDEDQKNRECYESDTPFVTLLAKASNSDLVNGTFTKIGDRYDHLVDALAYSPIERVIMLVWHVTGIIGNGGFEYLFGGELPGDPDLRITAEAFQKVGLARSYEAFQDAFRLFSGGIVPHDPEERWRQYDAANRSARNAINRKQWRDDWDHLVEKKVAEFIRQHAAELLYLDGE